MGRLVLVGRALDPVRSEHPGATLPALPAERAVQAGRFFARGQRTELVGAADHAVDAFHQRPAVAAATAVEADGYRFHVARPEGAAAVEHASLDHRCVGDDRPVLPDERVDSTQGVIPVVVVEVAREGLVEEGTERGQAAGVE